MIDTKQLFTTQNEASFEALCLEVFQYQFENNKVYRSFCDLLYIHPSDVKSISQIPFLPIQFFKTHQIVANTAPAQEVFLSSGTTGTVRSKHYVSDLSLYKKSFRKSFELFYGAITDYTILALLPSYQERDGSSLIYMVDDLIKQSKNAHSGYYLNDLKGLTKELIALDKKGKKVLLIGVSYALLDLIAKSQFQLKNTIVLETGGMKGRRKEMVKPELHKILKKGFGLATIHSEYGMTELLSQAYSQGEGLFKTPPWMKILIRDTEDPLSLLNNGKTGGINVIDLANINSCAFIATQDLGKTYADGSFEILGRFDNSDIRGCNLLVD
jgi:phenylacetate-coenzyme A ligase PaaK-like adenylate-forming protein